MSKRFTLDDIVACILFFFFVVHSTTKIYVKLKKCSFFITFQEERDERREYVKFTLMSLCVLRVERNENEKIGKEKI